MSRESKASPTTVRRRLHHVELDLAAASRWILAAHEIEDVWLQAGDDQLANLRGEAQRLAENAHLLAETITEHLR